MSITPHPVSRRTFLGSAASGLAVVSFSRAASQATSKSSTKGKKLLATTDYTDNIGNGLFSRVHLDSLHRYLAELGVHRHQWIVDTVWNLYDRASGGFDLLAEAVQSAHHHGLEFYAEIKPFEGGGFTDPLPHSFPIPDPSTAVQDMRGIHPMVRPFVAQNPHLCLRRRPGTTTAKGPITTIRLVRGDDRPTRIKAEHLSIWSSKRNCGFTRYQGAVSFRETVEWRPSYPKSQNCRILHLEGLRLPDDHTYILVRCSLADPRGDFANERGSIIELDNKNGEHLPYIASTGPVTFADHSSNYNRYPLTSIVRYLQQPDVQSVFNDPATGEKLYQDYFCFSERQKTTALHTLDRAGYIAVACGKPEYMIGNLHPIYPEVRRHWLDMVQYCLDRGVDGINIRHSNHSRSPEAWEYGFNEPVLQASGGRTDYPTIRRINGDAYTQFLRETRQLVKKHSKGLTIHIYSQMLMPDDRPEQLSYIPPNIDWQWETWVRDIADDVELRGAWSLRPWNLRQVVETISRVTREAGKPFYFQGNMKEIKYDWPLDITAAELDMMSRHPEIHGFVLYETAHFASMSKEGIVKQNPDLEKLLKNYYQ